MKKLSSLMILVLVIAILPTFAVAQKGPAVEVVGDGSAEVMVPGGYPAAVIPEAVLYDNGPLVTHPGGGYNGEDASVLQSNLGLNTYGFGNQVYYGYRMADDFTITDPGGWQVDEVVFYAYQTGTYGYPPVSTITGLYYQIWDGSPDDPGSSVVFGDLVTNRLTGTSWPNMYRVLDTAMTNTQRPPMANAASAGVILPPGTYWLDWMTDGSGASGPWAPPISIVGQTTTGNALQYTTAWAPALDTGLGTPQGMPFLVFGEVIGSDPDIEVTPASMSAEQCADTVTTQTLSICNVGGADLTWSLSEVPGVKQVSWTPSPKVTRNVELKLDAAGGGSVNTNPPTVDAPVSLVLDDGSRENDIGLGGTIEMLWVNRFTPDAGEFPFDLTEVQVYFSTLGLVNVGDEMVLIMYENTTGNNDPAAGSSFLASFDVTVQALDTWNVYTLPTPVTFAGPGDAVIGLIGMETPGTSYWPASMDQTATQARSWAGWWNTSPPPVPPLLPPPNWTLIDAYFPGNWMVRGYGETGGEPGIPWLSEDPTSGTIPAGGCVDVTVTFDSTGLAVGSYFGDLLIDSNDPDEPQVVVPVQMDVIDCNAYPDIEVTPASLSAEQCPDTVTQQTLQICNVGTADLTWTLTEQPAPMAGGIDSLSGSNVVFDPSVGGDACYTPGTAGTFCFKAHSFSSDWEYVYNVWQKFPADWTVTNVYVQGTPYCAHGTWGSFSWSFETSPHEVNINHARYQYNYPDENCIAYYCFEASAGASADASWYWDGDGYNSVPHHPCSSDQYTPASMLDYPCDEWVNPLATVPQCGGGDIPWLAEDPVVGTVPAGACQDVAVTFDSTGLAAGDYFGDLLIDSNDPDEPTVTVPVQLTVSPCGNTLTCGLITSNLLLDPYGREVIKWWVEAIDQNLASVPLVAVDADLTWPTGGPVSRTRYTHLLSGFARFHWGSAVPGTWTIDVTNMTLAGYTFADGPQCTASVVGK